LKEIGVPFKIVVEKEEYEDYAKIARKNSESSEDYKNYYDMIIDASIKTTHPELIKMY
jgi:hypothetical protein